MTPLQRSAHRLARADRYRPHPLPRVLQQIAQGIAIMSAIALVGLASYYWHSRSAVPQCLATSYDDCE